MRRRLLISLLLAGGIALDPAGAQDATQQEAQQALEQAMRQMRQALGQTEPEEPIEMVDDDEPLPEGLVLGEDGVPRLVPELAKVLRRGGWPPNLGEIPAPTDTVLRRGQPPLVGDLQFLGAFALVTPQELHRGDATSGDGSASDREERVPREQIAGVLPNGRGFPERLPLLPPEEDGVVDDSELLHTGAVQIATPNVTAGGRTLQEGQVALVHLGVTPNPDDFGQAKETPEPDDRERPPPPPTEDPGGANPGEAGGRNPGGEGRLPRVPDSGCWVGRILYTVNSKFRGVDDNTYDVRYKVWLTERPMHGDTKYATIGGSLTPVALDVLALSYTVQKDQMTIRDEGGSHTWDPWKVSGMAWGDEMGDSDRQVGMIHYAELDGLEERMRALYPTMPQQQLQQMADNVRAGYESTEDSYSLSPPLARSLPDYEQPEVRVVIRAAWGRAEEKHPFVASDPPVAIGWSGAIATGDPERRFLDEDRSRMAGRFRRVTQLAATPHEYSAYWQLTKHDKESCVVSLPDLPPDDSLPCDHLRAKLARAEGWARDDSAELDWIAAELEAMAPEFARLGASMEALRPYFELALGLSAVSDASQELLKMAVASHRLQAAASARQITRGMAARITAVMKLMSLIASPGGWTFSETVEDQTKQIWAERFIDDNVGNPADLIGLYQRFQVIAAYTREDDLDLVLDYVDNNLGMWVGSDYVIRKAKGYVQQAKKWNDLWSDAAQLTGRAIRLDYQVSNAEMEAEHWRRQLEECEEEFESRPEQSARS